MHANKPFHARVALFTATETRSIYRMTSLMRSMATFDLVAFTVEAQTKQVF